MEFNSGFKGLKKVVVFDGTITISCKILSH